MACAAMHAVHLRNMLGADSRTVVRSCDIIMLYGTCYNGTRGRNKPVNQKSLKKCSTMISVTLKV